jgi:hypothetical protein
MVEVLQVLSVGAVAVCAMVVAVVTQRGPRRLRPKRRAEREWDRLMRGASVTNRTNADIVKAHDTLRALVEHSIPPVTMRSEQELTAMLDVLCWTLGHEHNARFDNFLDGVEDNLHEIGFVRMVIHDDGGADAP